MTREHSNQKEQKIHYKLFINVSRHTSCRNKSSEGPPKKFYTNHTQHWTYSTKATHCTTNIWDIAHPYNQALGVIEDDLNAGQFKFPNDFLRQYRDVSLLKRLLSILRKLSNFLLSKLAIISRPPPLMTLIYSGMVVPGEKKLYIRFLPNL